MNITLLSMLAVFFAIIITILIALVLRRPGKEERSGAPDIAALHAKLEEILWLFRLPQQRGALGEQMLQQLLAEYLPRASFSLQYTFRNGSRVDAVVRMGNAMLPIDSKFPLEQVAELLKKNKSTQELPKQVQSVMQKYVDSISERYINPAEGTTPYALLYIPSESIYYHTFVSHTSKVFSYAYSRHVIPVSPGTLFLYMQTVASALREAGFSKNRHAVLEKIQQLCHEIEKLQKYLNTSTSHLHNLEGSWNQLSDTSRHIAALSRRLTEEDMQ